MKNQKIKENIEFQYIIQMKIIFKEENKLNLDQLNKKIILMIKKIKEDYNY